METNINPTDITHPITASIALSIKATISSAYTCILLLLMRNLVLKSHSRALYLHLGFFFHSAIDVILVFSTYSTFILSSSVRSYPVLLHNSLPSLLKSPS